MKLQFFTIPVHDPQTATDEMNVFLSSHRVVTVERQFVADGANSLWSVCVSYIEGEGRPGPEKRHRRVDYRDVLPAKEFAIFSQLRQLRKELAEQEGVPVYAVFTNDHLGSVQDPCKKFQRYRYQNKHQENKYLSDKFLQ